MTPLDDPLLNELRAARPVLTPEPAATSAQAQAMRDAIVSGGGARHNTRPGHTDTRQPRRRLLLPAVITTGLAAAAAVTLMAGPALAPGAAHHPGAARPDAVPVPSTQSVRTAVLDALQRASGAIAYSSQIWSKPGQPGYTLQTWTYPAAPAPGQLTRYRQFMRQRGAPFQDVEFIYPAGRLITMITHPMPPVTGQVIDVEYATRTWSDQTRTPLAPALVFGPAQIRQLIAAGHYRVLGRVRLDGRAAVEFGWSDGPGAPARLWVDARTYLPLKSEFGSVTAGQETIAYRMLPATAANLALLRPPIPAGFRRTAAPPAHPHG